MDFLNGLIRALILISVSPQELRLTLPRPTLSVRLKLSEFFQI